MPDPRSYDRINPFKIAGVCDRHAARSLKLQAKLSQIDRERAGRAKRKINVLLPIPLASHEVQGCKAARRALPARDLVGDTRLDDEFLVVELRVALDVQSGSVEPTERISGDVEAPGKSKISPHQVGEEGKASLARLEIAHPSE